MYLLMRLRCSLPLLWIITFQCLGQPEIFYDLPNGVVFSAAPLGGSALAPDPRTGAAVAVSLSANIWYKVQAVGEFSVCKITFAAGVEVTKCDCMSYESGGAYPRLHTIMSNYFGGG